VNDRLLPELGIRRACPDDAGAIIDTMTEAMSSGPAAEWLIPDARHRTRPFRAYAETLRAQTLAQHGFIDVVPSLAGAALWLPGPSVAALAVQDEERALRKVFGPAAFDRLLRLDHAIRRRTPTAPHHRLTLIAVDPSTQRRGIGTLLLGHHLAHLDSTRTLAVLVATNIRAVKLFLRPEHAFSVSERFVPEHGGPDLWAMRRIPGGAR